MTLLNDYTETKLSKLILKQLKNWYPISKREKRIIFETIPKVLSSVEKSFVKINNKYYTNETGGVFNPYHNGQYTFLLYRLSREIFINNQDNQSLCDKIYNLIKIFFSCDLFYQVKMPEIFFFDHPMGSVIGRADYSDYFTFSQGCTVGNNKGIYPRFGKYVHLLSNSKVIGNCNIGNHVIISANTYVKDMDVPDFSLVFGASPNIVTKQIDLDAYKNYAGSMFKLED